MLHRLNKHPLFPSMLGSVCLLYEAFIFQHTPICLSACLLVCLSVCRCVCVCVWHITIFHRQTCAHRQIDQHWFTSTHFPHITNIPEDLKKELIFLQRHQNYFLLILPCRDGHENCESFKWQQILSSILFFFPTDQSLFFFFSFLSWKKTTQGFLILLQWGQMLSKHFLQRSSNTNILKCIDWNLFSNAVAIFFKF